MKLDLTEILRDYKGDPLASSPGGTEPLTVRGYVTDCLNSFDYNPPEDLKKRCYRLSLRLYAEGDTIELSPGDVDLILERSALVGTPIAYGRFVDLIELVRAAEVTE